MDPRKTIKFFNRTMTYDNLDRLSKLGYVIDLPLARQYQKYNTNHFGYIDRTGNMKHFFQTIPETPIPKFISGYNKTFYDVTLARAQELVDTGKELYVFWSGGLDSTTILAALYYLNIDTNRIVVCMTPDSLYESGNLYDEVIKKKFNRYWMMLPATNNIFDKVPQKAISVTGNHGSLISKYKRNGMAEEINKMKYDNYFDKKFIDFYYPFISSFPIPIVTIDEFLHFVAFNFHWNANEYFMYHAGVTNPTETFFNFFKTMEYQNLFISSNEMLYDKGNMKNFIVSCMGNKAKPYIENKKVRISYMKELNNNLFVLGDNTVVRNFDELEALQ